MTAKPTITFVGESNPYSMDPSHALLPWPRGATGHRLTDILGLDEDAYVRDFSRVNLCIGIPWSIRMARITATCLLEDGRPLVLLGSKVCSAFGVQYDPFEIKSVWTSPFEDPVSVLVLPHPSGLNRVWNDPTSRRSAREAFARFLLIHSPSETTDAEDR